MRPALSPSANYSQNKQNLHGFGIADRITGRLQFTVEPENQNFSKTNFLRMMSTPFSYSKGSGLYLAATYSQNKIKLIKCSIWRPDNPKTSIFSSADIWQFLEE